MKTVGESVGKFVPMWCVEPGNCGAKRVAKILSCDEETQWVRYEMMDGPNKGTVKKSRYDRSQKVKVFDTVEETLKEIAGEG